MIVGADPARQVAFTRRAQKKEVARHSTALRERRYRCYLPVLAGFTRLPMHGAWPTEKVARGASSATGNSSSRMH